MFVQQKMYQIKTYFLHSVANCQTKHSKNIKNNEEKKMLENKKQFVEKAVN